MKCDHIALRMFKTQYEVPVPTDETHEFFTNATQDYYTVWCKDCSFERVVSVPTAGEILEWAERMRDE